MRFSHFLVITLAIALFGCFPLWAWAQESVETETPVETKSEITTEIAPADTLSPEQRSSVVQFYAWASAVPKELIDLKASLRAVNYEKMITSSIPALTADTRDLRWEVSTTKTAPYLRKYLLDRFQRNLIILEKQSTSMNSVLQEGVERLSAKRNQWLAHKKTYQDFKNQKELIEVTSIKDIEDFMGYIDEALKIIETNLAPALMAGRELSNTQMELQSIEVELHALQRSHIENRNTRSPVTMLSASFYEAISPAMVKEIFVRFNSFLMSHTKIIKSNIKVVFIGIFFFVFLVFAVSFSRKLVKASSRWHAFASCPIATTTFIISAIHILIQPTFSLEFEHQWGLLISSITILAVIFLIRKTINKEWKRGIFIRLSVYMLILIGLTILQMPQVLMLLFVFVASCAAFLLYLYLIRSEFHSSTQRFLYLTWGSIPAVIIVACLTGYDLFAIYLFTTLISSITLCLLTWMLFHLFCGLIELSLLLSPATIIKDNIPTIVNALQPIIALLHIVFAFTILATIFDISSSPRAAIQSIFDLGYVIGGMRLSPGFFLTIFLVLYGTMLFSRAIQSVLLIEVLPRYKTGKGVQISITRLVHYAILTIGFFLMLSVLGFKFEQLTILGGALGVGIGFGLQAIVNNFVSGLIMLFERPIKVGDTIQVGTDLGEVKSLGLRATIIQTFDNAEIVVPNSDLITGQVTNWTLAERKVRIRLPVGVAYGTDVARVLEILRQCAQTHPMVLNQPKPAAFFLAFGASSLDFELRFWIPEFLDKMTAISELNQSIESEFALNEIEIPFPQSDLHIRTIHPNAAQAFQVDVPGRGSATQATSSTVQQGAATTPQ